jgi:uncharacterized protein YggT (Ycf19 family)
MADFVTIRVPNGESFTDLHSRVVDFIQSEPNTHSKPVDYWLANNMPPSLKTFRIRFIIKIEL